MRVFRIVITGEEPPFYTITNAFKSVFGEVDTLYWDEYNDINYVNELIRARVKSIKYDFVFMQIQKANVISENTAKVLSENSLVFNWTGDVRTNIDWFKELSPYCVTLFTNTKNVEDIRAIGQRADYLQTGFDDKYYFNLKKTNRLNNIAFCGNYYPTMDFPLTQKRADVVRLLKVNYPENFNLYGANWDKADLKSEGIANNMKEAVLYNATSLALSISHFDYGRYFSDRLLRELACGCCVLSHRFKDCNLEFTENKHILYWETNDELLEKVNYYFKHPEKARIIGDNAAEYVLENYKWDVVLKKLKELIKKYK
jgi:glycosyltransferase involved in cell wall biosynthesis